MYRINIQNKRVWVLCVLAAFFVSCGLPSGNTPHVQTPEKEVSSMAGSVSFSHKLESPYKENGYYFAYSLSSESQAKEASNKSWSRIYHDVRAPKAGELYLLVPELLGEVSYPVSNDCYERGQEELYASVDIRDASNFNQLVQGHIQYNFTNKELKLSFVPELKLISSSGADLSQRNEILLLRLTSRTGLLYPELKGYNWDFDEDTIDYGEEKPAYLQLYVAFAAESLNGQDTNTDFVYLGEIELR